MGESTSAPRLGRHAALPVRAAAPVGVGVGVGVADAAGSSLTQLALPRFAARRSGRVGTGSQSVGRGGAEIGPSGGGALLKLVQRVGVNGYVQPHLGALGRAADAQRLTEQLVELVGGDLVVVHPYVMLIYRSRR